LLVEVCNDVLQEAHDTHKHTFKLVTRPSVPRLGILEYPILDFRTMLQLEAEPLENARKYVTVRE